MWHGELGKMSDVTETKAENKPSFSRESLEKFDKIMGDDKLESISKSDESKPSLTPEEIESKFRKLFEEGDFFEMTDVDNVVAAEESPDHPEYDSTGFESQEEPDYSERRELNSQYELDGNKYETDDNGQTYKKNGELLPNDEYKVKGSTYRTDEKGRPISCDAKLQYTEDGSRNMKEQRESGGEERQEDDDGGHIVARILGGVEGIENLVPMRRTINRGDYKKMENEISKALQEGKEVTLHIDIEYDGDSSRPSEICAEYTIDGKRTVCEFDNNENSIELLDTVKDKISDEDYSSLKAEIDDMKEDGVEASLTSVKREYDENDNPTKITVGTLDESTGKKTYKVYEPKQEV